VLVLNLSSPDLSFRRGRVMASLCTTHGLTKPPTLVTPLVNTKNWYRKGTDLWTEFGNEMPFGKKNILRGFGKDACGRQYAIIRQKDCLRF
jgi:hypothetical protein